MQRRFAGVSVRVRPVKKAGREVRGLPVPSGPNSVPKAPSQVPELFHPPLASEMRSTERGRLVRRQIIDVPPLSSPFGSNVRSGALDAPRGARCSLERR
jgi:hypothetical protein